MNSRESEQWTIRSQTIPTLNRPFCHRSNLVVRGKDYPVRNDKVSLAMTAVSLNNETVLGGNIHSDLRLIRGLNFSVNANINSRKMGQLCIKTSSTEHMEIALITVVSIFGALMRKMAIGDSRKEKLDMGWICYYHYYILLVKFCSIVENFIS